MQPALSIWWAQVAGSIVVAHWLGAAAIVATDRQWCQQTMSTSTSSFINFSCRCRGQVLPHADRPVIWFCVIVWLAAVFCMSHVASKRVHAWTRRICVGTMSCLLYSIRTNANRLAKNVYIHYAVNLQCDNHDANKWHIICHCYRLWHSESIFCYLKTTMPTEVRLLPRKAVNEVFSVNSGRCRVSNIQSLLYIDIE